MGAARRGDRSAAAPARLRARRRSLGRDHPFPHGPRRRPRPFPAQRDRHVAGRVPGGARARRQSARLPAPALARRLRPDPRRLRVGAFGPFPASTSLTRAGDVHLLPTPGHTGGHLSVAVEDGDALVFLAGDASYTQRLMLDGRADGVAPKPSQAIETLTRIQRLVAERPTVYLPTHDPESTARLTAREVAASAAGEVTR